MANKDEWTSIIDTEEGEFFVISLIEEILTNSQQILFEKSIDVKVLPYTVQYANNLIQDIIKFFYFQRDPGVTDGTLWIPDQEPECVLIDSWAPASVPVRKAPAKAFRHPTSTSQKPDENVHELDRKVKASPIVKAKNEVPKRKVQVATHQTARQASRPRIVEPLLDRQRNRSVKSTPLKMEKSAVDIHRNLKDESKKNLLKMATAAEEKTDYTYDHNGKIIALSTGSVWNQPVDVKFKVSLTAPSESPEKATIATRSRVMGATAKPLSNTVTKKKTASESVKKRVSILFKEILDNEHGFQDDPKLRIPLLIDTMRISPGVTLREGDAIKTVPHQKRGENKVFHDNHGIPPTETTPRFPGFGLDSEFKDNKKVEESEKQHLMEKYSKFTDQTTGINPFIVLTKPKPTSDGISFTSRSRISMRLLATLIFILKTSFLVCVVLISLLIPFLPFVFLKSVYLKDLDFQTKTSVSLLYYYLLSKTSFLVRRIVLRLVLFVFGVNRVKTVEVNDKSLRHLLEMHNPNKDNPNQDNPNQDNLHNPTKNKTKANLIISNHTSPLDILFYMHEFRSPVFLEATLEGLVRPMSGLEALYTSYKSGGRTRVKAGPTDVSLARALAALPKGATAVLFPEGTTTNGRGVLRFLPLFKGVTRVLLRERVRVQVWAIRYMWTTVSPCGGRFNALWAAVFTTGFDIDVRRWVALDDHLYHHIEERPELVMSIVSKLRSVDKTATDKNAFLDFNAAH